MRDLSPSDIGSAAVAAAADAYANYYFGGRGVVDVLASTIGLLEAADPRDGSTAAKKLAVARANLRLVKEALAADPAAANLMTARRATA